MLYSLLNAIEANEAVESAHGCQVPVYGLKIVRIATSWNEEGKTTKIGTRRLETPGERDGWHGRWPRWRCITRCRKSGRKRGFPPSTGFPPRPLLAISGIHVYTHTYSASCSCDLEPEPTNSHRSVSLFFDLSIRAEKSSAMKIDATFVICSTEAVCFRKKRIIVLYLFCRKKFQTLVIFRTNLKGIYYMTKRLGSN